MLDHDVLKIIVTSKEKIIKQAIDVILLPIVQDRKNFKDCGRFRATYPRLTLKILSDQIWVAGYFGQPLTYPYFTIFSSDFLCNSLKS
jgi:hypothetical protein